MSGSAGQLSGDSNLGLTAQSLLTRIACSRRSARMWRPPTRLLSVNCVKPGSEADAWMGQRGHSLPAAERVGPPCLPVAGPRQEDWRRGGASRGAVSMTQHHCRPPGHREFLHPLHALSGLYLPFCGLQWARPLVPPPGTGGPAQPLP